MWPNELNVVVLLTNEALIASKTAGFGALNFNTYNCDVDCIKVSCIKIVQLDCGVHIVLVSD